MPRDPVGDEAVMNIDDPIRRAKRNNHRKDVGPPRRRGKRPPFDTEYVIKVRKDKQGGIIKVTGGGPPKKLTKNLKHHLRKVLRQNPTEAERQLGMLGLTGDPYKILGVEKA